MVGAQGGRPFEVLATPHLLAEDYSLGGLAGAGTCASPAAPFSTRLERRKSGSSAEVGTQAQLLSQPETKESRMS